MRTRTALALAAAILLAAPTAAAAQGAGDERVRRDAAALPAELWEPAPEPVSAAGPGLPEDGVGVAPVITVLLLLTAVGAGYAVSVLRPARAGEPAAPAALPVVHPTGAERETCAIALSRERGRGRFEVRAEHDGGRVVATSLDFDVRRGRPIEPAGPAGRAHRRLLLHLVAAGWELEPEAEGGAWYERRLSRPAGQPPAVDLDRGLVVTRPEGDEAEFVALALDEYGNAQVMARSPRFRRRADRPVEETESAVAAHAALLEDLENDGWRPSGTLETWYGATLARRRP
jgi:hypothetical protein